MEPDEPRHIPGARTPGWCWTHCWDQRVTFHSDNRRDFSERFQNTNSWLMEHNDQCDSKWLDAVDKTGVKGEECSVTVSQASHLSLVLTRLLCNTSLCPAAGRGETPPLLNIILDNDNLNRNLPQLQWYFMRNQERQSVPSQWWGKHKTILLLQVTSSKTYFRENSAGVVEGLNVIFNVFVRTEEIGKFCLQLNFYLSSLVL